MYNDAYRILNAITIEMYSHLHNLQQDGMSDILRDINATDIMDYLDGYADAVNDLFTIIKALTAEIEAKEEINPINPSSVLASFLTQTTQTGDNK